MNNFHFFNPTRIVFSQGQVSEINELVPEDARVQDRFAEASRIDAAITRTRDFFEQMDARTRLQDYQISAADIPAMLKQLSDHGLTQLGEHGDVDLDKSRKILEASSIPVIPENARYQRDKKLPALRHQHRRNSHSLSRCDGVKQTTYRLALREPHVSRQTRVPAFAKGITVWRQAAPCSVDSHEALIRAFSGITGI